MTKYASLLVMFVLLWISPVSAADYCLADDGSGSTCSCGSPCASVSTWLAKATVAGDRLFAECGATFRITSNQSTPSAGTSGSPKLVFGYERDQPCVNLRGTHTGAGNASSLTDDNTDFVASNIEVGMEVVNESDGSSCVITSVAAHVLGCTTPLRGGLENDWDDAATANRQTGDEYWIHNGPLFTQSVNYTTGWTNEGSDVWSHALTARAIRTVWINRATSVASQVLDSASTCSVANLASMPDLSFCATTEPRLYLRTSTNPATRWASPQIGVEVTDAGTQGYTAFSMNDQWWIFDGLRFMMGTRGGFVFAISASNITLKNSWLRHGGPQHPSPIWGSSALDGDGGILLSIGTSISNVLIQDNLITDAGRNLMFACGQSGSVQSGISYIGNTWLNSFGYAATNDCGQTNSSSTNPTWLHNKFRHLCLSYFSGNQSGTSITGWNFQDNLIENGVLESDSRVYTPQNSCGTTNRGVAIDIPYTNGVFRNNVVTGQQYGVRLKWPVTLERNTIYDNTRTGVTILGNANSRTFPMSDNVIAENGTSSTTGTNNAQVACDSGTGSCATATLTGSKNLLSKVSGGAGSGLMSFGGIDSSMTKTEIEARWAGFTGTVEEDPEFVDAGEYDFNPSNNGNLHNTGTTATPKVGTNREIGALEIPTLGTCATIDADTWQCSVNAIFTPITSDCAFLTPKRTNPGPVTGAASNCETITNSNVRFDTNFSASFGDTLTLDVAYGGITDGHVLGAHVKAISAVSVTNTVVATSPSFTCEVGDTFRTKVRVTANTQGSPPVVLGGCPTGWAVRDDGAGATETTCALVTSNVFDITVSAPLTVGTNDLQYTASSGSTTNNAGVEFGNQGPTTCTNNIGTSPPAIVSWTVHNNERSTVYALVDLGNGTNINDVGALTGVTVAGHTVTGCVVEDADEFKCMVTPAFVNGESQTATYSQSTGNITDEALVEVANSTINVTNEVQSDTGTVTITEVRYEFAEDGAEDDPVVFLGFPSAPGTVRVRVTLECAGTCPARAYVPYASLNGATAVPVGNDFGTHHLRLGTDSQLEPLQVTTEQGAGCTGAFVPGRVYENPLTAFPSIALNNEECTNYVFVIEFGAGLVLGTDTLNIGAQADGGGLVQQDGTMTQTVNIGGGRR